MTSSATSKDSSTRIVPRYRVYRGKEIVLGPGKAQLLRHIAETGSISDAARLMDMSYNRAWLHVKIMNESFREPLVISTRGGTTGGGASLTETGRKTLALYDRLEREAAAATSDARKEIARLCKR
jgi:molybdate transport system regulatory protein